MKYLPQLATVHTAAVNYSQLHLMLFLGSTSMDLKIDLQSLNFLSQKCSKYIGINVTFENIQKSFLGLLGKQKALHLPVFSIFFFSSSIFSQNIGEFRAKKHFTHNRTPNTIHGFRDSVLVHKMYHCYCKIHKNGHMKKNHFKKAFKRVWYQIYLFELYSILVAPLLTNNLANICSKISKIGMNL